MSKYALITGGSRGIGRAICIKLAQEGYQVIINYASNEGEAQKTLEMTGGNGELLPFDVSNAEQVKAALQDWQQRHPDDYREWWKKYYAEHREEILIKQKARRNERRQKEDQTEMA
jgi:3-oxoacyl-[acyl-carrier protein] reductase